MSSDLPRDFFDDFYAECDDLFDTIWRSIDRLEQSAPGELQEADVVQTLFRSLHTLKGNAGIVALRVVEELAHAAEDLLRALARRREAATPHELELLRNATKALQQMVAAHQAKRPLPEYPDLIEELADSTAGSPPAIAPDSAPTPPPATTAAAAGAAVWHCTFTPSVEADRRGVNVASVRVRLSALGEILEAVPAVRPDGAIEFVFAVSARTEPTDFSSWEADGLRWQPPVAAQPPVAGGLIRAPALSLPLSPVVRVDLAQLDDLMRITAELVIHRSRLEDRLQHLDDALLREAVLSLGRSLRELRTAVSRVRLVPAAEMFNRIPLIVRDLTAEWEQPVHVVLEGQQTQIDKHVVERLKEPLLHLVRNALAHGIESPAERQAAGKPPAGMLSLRATGVGHFVEIEIHDDGRGIDRAGVAARATAAGLPVPEPLDDGALLRLLCHAGFSTRDAADRAAGRGIGMAVVANAVRELGGTLSFSTVLGKGSVFTVRIPLMRSIIEVILVTVGDQICAVPQDAVVQILQVPRAKVHTLEETGLLPYGDGGLVPLTSLRTWFRLDPGSADPLTLVILRTEAGTIGLVVDRALSQREVVLQPLRDPLVQVAAFSGATELGDGRPVLVLDPFAIVQATVSQPPRTSAAEPVALS